MTCRWHKLDAKTWYGPSTQVTFEKELNEFLPHFDHMDTNEPTVDKDQHGKLYNNIYDQDWDGEDNEYESEEGLGIQTYLEIDNEQAEKSRQRLMG